jgi:acyl-CoA dehydrogenase
MSQTTPPFPITSVETTDSQPGAHHANAHHACAHCAPRDPIGAGRHALGNWKAAQPTNFVAVDTDLRGGLERLLGEARFQALEPELLAQGAAVAAADALVDRLEHRLALPRLERYDAIGNRTEQVVYDSGFHDLGKVLYGTGVVSSLAEPAAATYTLALGYLNNQLGEAGHNCPIVCTMGAVRALQAAGSSDLRERYLPGLLTREYGKHLDAAQFMTEVQGGSDVGQNGVRAIAVGDGMHTLVGEKWFCSNASASVFLVTARPDGAPSGTAGLGLFLVPRVLPWGTLNDFKIRRLKEKLGTRMMASGEIDFEGACAWSIGPVESGFKTMMNHVINTSRLYNASGCLGMSRRALTVAWTYAQHRVAFGQPIGRYPLVQETLADMRAEHVVLLHGHLHLGALRDRLDVGRDVKGTDEGFFRVGLNLNKYRTCVSAGGVIRSAIELLGGNGAIETFSPLPRLLRDNVVYENWEGTHNTLAMQILRDVTRLGVGASFLGDLSERFAALRGGPAGDLGQRGAASLAELTRAMVGLADVDPALASLRMRPITDRMAYLMAACAAAEHGAWEAARPAASDTLALVRYFWRRRLDAPLALQTADALPELEALTRSAF